MATHTFTLDADFAPITNCSLVANAVIPAYWSWANDKTSTKLADWTAKNTTYGTVDITSNAGKLTLTRNATACAARSTTLACECNEAVSGNFTAQTKWESALNVQVDEVGLRYYVDANNWAGIFVQEDSGQHYFIAYLMIGGSGSVQGNSYPATNTSTSGYFKIARSGNNWTCSYSANGSSWTDFGAFAGAIGTTGKLRCYVWSPGTGATHLAKFSETQFTAGFPGTAEVLVNDSGAYSADAGNTKAFDNSTAVYTAANCTALSKYADYAADQGWTTAAQVQAGASWNGTWLTQAALRLEADTALRYRYQKFQLSSVAASPSLSEYTCDDYVADVTPPAECTGAVGVLLGQTVLTLDCVEPADADFAYAKKRVTISGSDYYWQVDGSGQWVLDTDAPSNWVRLADQDPAKEIPLTCCAIVLPAGTVQAAYTSTVDTTGNASAWTAHDISSSASQAATPTGFSLASGGDGLTWTLAFTSGETNPTAYVHTAAHAIVASGINGEKIRGLANNTGYHIHVLADGKTLSEASSAATSATLTANASAGAAYILAGHSDIVDGSTTNGTFDESARNVSAGAGNILVGAHEHIAGNQIDGTFDEAARNISAGAGNILSGAHEHIAGNQIDGTYTPDFPAVGNVRDTDTVNGSTGTLDSDKILKSNATGSGAGGWDDDNLGVGDEDNVADGVAFGLSQEGTLVGGGGDSGRPVIAIVAN